MRRWFTAPAAFFAAALILTSLSAPTVAQDPKKDAPPPEEEAFLTADGVQLKSLFHATAKNTAPVVVLMYPPGADRDMTKGDWAGLAKRLNDEGYHVLRFDWRGHGKSTKIDDTAKFWANPFTGSTGANFNNYVKGGPPKKPVKNDINYKDLGTNAARYLPAYLNDLAAVRVHLDSKNDNKTLNTSSVYLIGAGDAATLGLAWMTTEWQRPAVYPSDNQLGLGAASYEYVPQPLRGVFPPEGGQDIAGAVWLSPSRPATIPDATVKHWVNKLAPKLRDNNPMLFLYADKDAAGKKGSDYFFNEVLIGDPKKAKALGIPVLEATYAKEVKGGNQLSGVKLLGDNANLKTEETILFFLAHIQKQRAKLPSKVRKYDAPYYINTREYGLMP